MKAICALMLGSLLILGSACSSTEPQSVDDAPVVPLAQPTETSAPPPVVPAEMMAAAPMESHSTSVTSGTGVTLELPRVTYGAHCLSLNVALSGIFPPNGAASDYTPQPPVVNATFFSGSSALEVHPRGGGGGGGQATDGSFDIGQETVYEVSAPLPLGAPLPLNVQLTMESSLGFESPILFTVQAEPDDSLHCGLQGSEAP